MTVSSCLKTQLNTDPIAINNHIHYNEQNDVNRVIGSTVDDLIAFSHLSAYFNGYTEWSSTNPAILQPASLLFIGVFADSKTYAGHPANSLSLCGYSKASLQKQIANEVPINNFGTPVIPAAEWFNLVTQAKFSELNSIINDPLYQTDFSGNTTIIDQPTTLKIMRTTPSEIAALNLERPVDTLEYIDAFDIVKDRITRGVPVLENDGRAKAVYHEAGDYITFHSECALRLVFSVGV